MNGQTITDIEALYSGKPQPGLYFDKLPPVRFDWNAWNAEMDRGLEQLALADARCREAVADFMTASAELQAAIKGMSDV